MTIYNSSAYLRQKGFISLTGEACGYSMRQLVDLTEDGVKNLCSFLGVQSIQTNPPRNSGAVGSVMLTWHTMLDEIVPFMLLRDGNYVAWRYKENEYMPSPAWHGVPNKEDWKDTMEKSARSFDDYGTIVHVNWNWGEHDRDRNYHYASGRWE